MSNTTTKWLAKKKTEMILPHLILLAEKQMNHKHDTLSHASCILIKSQYEPLKLVDPTTEFAKHLLELNYGEANFSLQPIISFRRLQENSNFKGVKYVAKSTQLDIMKIVMDSLLDDFNILAEWVQPDARDR